MVHADPQGDGLTRCSWCEKHAEYRRYHDEEWGYPVADDRRLFEKICLEGFQSGLSWWTILQRRPTFRAAFAQFDIHKVAGFTQDDVDRLMQDTGIIRHRGKINATINNAARAIELRAEFGSLAAYFWSFDPKTQHASQPDPVRTYDDIPATTERSKALSKDLKKRGWKFVGPTTCYAFMQAMGMVNDHLESCAFHAKAVQARADFTPPRPS